MSASPLQLAKAIETLHAASADELSQTLLEHPEITSQAFFLGPHLMDAAAKQDPEYQAIQSEVLQVMPVEGSLQ